MPRAKKAIVKDNPDLVRDLSTNAIINNNRNAYEMRKAQIAISKKQEEERQCLNADVENLKSELNEIKSLLKKLVNGGE
jgi:hypothetical protein